MGRAAWAIFFDWPGFSKVFSTTFYLTKAVHMKVVMSDWLSTLNAIILSHGEKHFFYGLSGHFSGPKKVINLA